MISVIIPAHNEAAVIARGLEALVNGAEPGELEVIVACNGCTDETAAIARQYAPTVKVVETQTASKIAGLNLGDEHACGYPRFYVDADVVLSIESVRRIATVLREGSVPAACPRMAMDLASSSWPVRAYYRVWQRLPYTQAGMMGAGTYAMSEVGRSRFDKFPDVIADDGYVRLLFAEHERPAVPGAVSKVTAPATLGDLLRIKTRSRYGIYQLQQRYPELAQREAAAKNYGGGLRDVMRDIWLWPCVPVYVWVAWMSRRRARRQMSAAGYVWERDESSRQSPATTPTP
ncbi:glycosyltransferase [Phycisphaerales bacterium AB-hyl4]|uniref:Glycosyltransferase n=1 Tax=Natronomicrosphaera hydrolytica TaxID=3242702 RepID=A0ABV4U5W8_9BACT